MVFKKALQQMLDQVYEAAQGDVRTSPVFREGEFGGPRPAQRPTVFTPRQEGASTEAFGAPETVYPRKQAFEGSGRFGADPESTVGETARRAESLERRTNTPEAASVAVRRPAPAARATPDASAHRTNVLDVLRSGSGLRTALVLSEIVGPPRAMRGLDEPGR